MPDQHTRVLLGGYRTAEHTLTNGGESSPCPSPALGGGDQLRVGCGKVGECAGDESGKVGECVGEGSGKVGGQHLDLRFSTCTRAGSGKVGECAGRREWQSRGVCKRRERQSPGPAFGPSLLHMHPRRKNQVAPHVSGLRVKDVPGLQNELNALVHGARLFAAHRRILLRWIP